MFDQRDEDGIAEVVDETPGPEQYDNDREAAQIGPSAYMHVSEG